MSFVCLSIHSHLFFIHFFLNQSLFAISSILTCSFPFPFLTCSFYKSPLSSTHLPLLSALFFFFFSFPALPAPGCDQGLQLGVHAALQLDSGHGGPQSQHCVQPHSLWVRTPDCLISSVKIYCTPQKNTHDINKLSTLETHKLGLARYAFIPIQLFCD